MRAIRPIAQAAQPRLAHRAALLRELQAHPRLSRAALARATGLHKATISNLVQELIDEGFLVEVDRAQGRTGRPSVMLEFARAGKLVVGAQLDSTEVRVVLTNLKAEVLTRRQAPVNRAEPQARVLETLHDAIATVLAEARPLPADILGIGVSLPGIVDVDAGVLVRSDPLGWRHVPIRQLLEQRHGLQVAVEKSTNAALFAEHVFGAARGHDHALYVEAAVNGIGGAILVDGELYRGGAHFAGEFGHMAVDPNGPRCSCGNRGCWETVADGNAVLRHAYRLRAQDDTAQAGAIRFDTPEDVLAAATVSPLAVAAIKETARWLGVGLASLINLLGPQVAIVGGSLVAAAPAMWGTLRESARGRALGELADSCRIVAPHLGADAYALGAATVAGHAVLLRPPARASA